MQHQKTHIMKQILPLLTLLLLGITASAQSYNEAFYDALNEDNLAKQRQILADWKLASPDDVDLYIASYNYYANYAMAGLTSDTPQAPNQAIADSGIAVIEEAIALYPERLDLRFGKIYFLGQVQRWDEFSNEIIRTLDHSEQIDHRWRYPNFNESFVLLMQESVQDYQQDMFGQIADTKHLSSQDSAMVMRIRRVAQRTVQVFPHDIYAINNMGITYNIMKDYERSIKYFLRAEKVDPNNPVILRNIADTYSLQGKKKLAQQYQDRLNNLEDEE